MPSPKKSTSDAVEILKRRYIVGKPEMEALYDAERVNADIARQIYELRTQAGLSQRELAQRVGTTASVICRLEGADYKGHSFSMLQRIATALDCRVEIHLVRAPRASRRPVLPERP